ncbi:Patatin phospholipase [Chromobacterium violaceum]|uniref:Patatin phospholipase n=1 Tax=Chromobacterium violaceum TaxID=536 RepID=A0A3S4IX29_CHRVL|nr:Patatin phospholipase [Chromobacterium violaceum]
MVSNTPLQTVLSERPRQHSLVFQVDLWSARGELPSDLSRVALRQKDIQYSSRTRMITDYMRESQQFRQLLREVMELVPEAARDSPAYRRAAVQACDRLFNVVHLIYQDKPCEGHYKDYQFGARTMREHWASGLADIRATLAHPEWLAMPTPDRPSSPTTCTAALRAEGERRRTGPDAGQGCLRRAKPALTGPGPTRRSSRPRPVAHRTPPSRSRAAIGGRDRRPAADARSWR